MGVYGLLAQAVTERTREFGIRLAVGATPGRVFRLVLGDASLVAGAGAIAGLGLGRLGSRLIEAQFWGVSAHQAWIYGGTAFALVCVVVLAAAWPARTAMRIDPVDLLRAE